MLGLSGASSYAVFVYLCVCVLVFVYLCMRHLGISVLISLNNPLFKNMPHDGSLQHCYYAEFVYLCICICVFVYEALGNISLDILRPRAFRRCIVCMV